MLVGKKKLYIVFLVIANTIYSSETRVGLLPYHQRVKYYDMLQQYHRWQDKNQWYQERCLNTIDLSQSLQQNNPEQYEKNLRLYGERILKLKEQEVPYFMSREDRDKYYTSLTQTGKQYFSYADQFRQEYEKALEQSKGKVLENFLKEAVVVVITSVATVLTGGLTSPMLVASLTSFGMDTLHTAYVYYNLDNRNVYDAFRWSESEEYKFSQIVSASAKVSLGFSTGQLTFSDPFTSLNSVVSITSIGSPYYNQDANRIIGLAQAGLSSYSSFRSLTTSPVDIVSQSRSVAERLDIQYGNLYTAAMNWQNVVYTAQMVSNLTQLSGSLYAFYSKLKQEPIREDFTYYARLTGVVASGLAQVGYHQTSVNTLSANEEVIRQHGMTRLNVYNYDANLSLGSYQQPFAHKYYQDQVSQLNNVTFKMNESLKIMYALQSQAYSQKQKESIYNTYLRNNSSNVFDIFKQRR